LRRFVVLVFMMPLSLVVNTLFYLNSTFQFAWSRWTGAGEEMHYKRVNIVRAPRTLLHPCIHPTRPIAQPKRSSAVAWSPPS